MDAFHENKQDILTAFCKYLQTTSNGRHIERILYVKTDNGEYAVVYWAKEGWKPTTVDITADSGTGMAKDILNKVFK